MASRLIKTWKINKNMEDYINTELELSKTTLRPSQTDKLLCQTIARTLWDIYPDMSIEDIKKHKAIQIYGNGKQYKGKNTLRDWLKEVDPRPKDAKTGRPRKVPVYS